MQISAVNIFQAQMIQKILCIANTSISEEPPFVMSNNSNSPELNNADIYTGFHFIMVVGKT